MILFLLFFHSLFLSFSENHKYNDFKSLPEIISDWHKHSKKPLNLPLFLSSSAFNPFSFALLINAEYVFNACICLSFSFSSALLTILFSSSLSPYFILFSPRFAHFFQPFFMFASDRVIFCYAPPLLWQCCFSLPVNVDMTHCPGCQAGY